jgi:DNA-binding GntR family transcriptional regulator
LSTSPRGSATPGGAVIADGPVSRIEWVEEQLRMALLNGELAPGERLLTAQLSERFHVSPTPLREALHRFAGEGLVEFIPQRGARVAALSASESRELIELRTLLEPPCVGHAVDNATDEWAAELRSSADALHAALAARRHSVATSEHAYRAFYTALTSTCDSARLRRYATSVRDQHARYRTAALGGLDRGRLAEVIASLVTAALDADRKAADRAVLADLALFSSAVEEDRAP